jgi:hypothetical protein
MFSQDGTRLVTIGGDGIAQLWSTRTAGRMAALSAEGPVSSAVFAPSGPMLATAHRDGVVRCWDGSAGRMAAPALSQPGSIHAMLLSLSGRRLAVLSQHGDDSLVLRAWEVRDGQALLRADLTIASSQPVIVCERGGWMAYADGQLVRVWDVERCQAGTAFAIRFGERPDAEAQWQLGAIDAEDASSEEARRPAVRRTQSPYLAVLNRPVGPGSPRANRAYRAQILNAEHVLGAEDALHERRILACHHQVQGPAYVAVAISACVARRSENIDPKRTQAEVRAALLEFFDPLHGGPDGSGWPLGRDVYSSELCQTIEGLESVDHVNTLTLNGSPDMAPVPPLSLVQCIVGAIDVE